ncbi:MULTISPECIES: PTS cellobiose transporter subunit IIA [Enterococcus]|uniref:PTS cellobiose transporter subunit IIA n=1 Tax=Enterococcus alishanensis TaxID=1303817 RepID=A0ABS6TB25_9ENTE|nr:PTS cellobiose transporter subunit IIA [Enterococcus alishanensis]MBV7390100.1 PTS cellobiose transporter subunit IIA [Enterococcus alishanensis]
MDNEKLQEIAFKIILSSGDARTLIHEAFKAMREKNFKMAHQYIDDVNEALIEAHKVQTSLLQKYAEGKKIELEIIMVHAQDHLMTTMTLKEVAIEMLYLYKEVAEK